MNNVIQAEHYFRCAAIMGLKNYQLIEARAALSFGGTYRVNKDYYLYGLDDLAMVLEEMADRRMNG